MRMLSNEITILGIVLIALTTLAPRNAYSNVGMCTGKCAKSKSLPLYLAAGFAYTPNFVVASNSSGVFNGYGWSGEAGLILPFSESFGILAAGTAGGLNISNVSNSSSAVEVGQVYRYGGKVGFALSLFTLGGGLGRESVSVNTVVERRAAAQSSYSGVDYFGFLELSLGTLERVGVNLETQYHYSVLNNNAIAKEVTLIMKFDLLIFGDYKK